MVSKKAMETLPIPSKVGLSTTPSPDLQDVQVSVKGEDGEPQPKVTRRTMILFALATALILVGVGIYQTFPLPDDPEPKDVFRAHVHLSDRSVQRISEILNSKARRLQEVEDILGEDDEFSGDSKFSIDAFIDKVDVTKIRDHVKSQGQVHTDITSCPAGADSAEDGCLNTLNLTSVVADSIDETVPGEFSVAGTMSEDSVRRLRALAGMPEGEIREDLHFEINCDLEDPEAFEEEGCDVEVFNLMTETDANSSAPKRRACGRRRRRRRRRYDRRRRRNIFRSRRALQELQEMNASSARSMPLVLSNQSAGTEIGDRQLNALYGCPWSCLMHYMGDGLCHWQCNRIECNYDDTDCANFVIDIERTLVDSESGTLGNLLLFKQANGKKTLLKKYHTLEPNFQSSLEGSKARILDGSYAAVQPHYSPRLSRNTIWLQNTWPRTEILIHPGNTVADTAGCILVGRRHYLKDDLELQKGSAAVLDDLLATMGWGSTLSVRIRGDPTPYQRRRASFKSWEDYYYEGQIQIHDYDWLPLPKYLPPLPCFPATATVKLASGFRKTMAELQFGDLIETFSSSGQVQYERFLMDFHGLNNVTAEFLRLNAGISKTLEVTPNHLIFTSGMSAVRAAALRPGDTLLVIGPHGELVPKIITKIETVLKRGLYAPLTLSGRLVVEGVAVSSYGMLWPEPVLQELETSHVGRWLVEHAHGFMHMGTTPLRWAQYVSGLIHRVLGVETVKPTGVEIHWFASFAKETFEEVIMFPLFPDLRAKMHVPGSS